MIAMSHSMTDHKKTRNSPKTNKPDQINQPDFSPQNYWWVSQVACHRTLPVTAACSALCVCHSVTQCDSNVPLQQCTVTQSDTVWHSVTQCNSSLPRTDDPIDLCHVKIWNPFWFTFCSLSLLSIYFRIGHLSTSTQLITPLKWVW